MKFQCEPTQEQITKRNDKTRARFEKFNQFHKVFAFLPHSIEDGKCVWLEYVYRKARADIGKPYSSEYDIDFYIYDRICIYN